MFGTYPRSKEHRFGINSCLATYIMWDNWNAVKMLLRRFTPRNWCSEYWPHMVMGLLHPIMCAFKILIISQEIFGKNKKRANSPRSPLKSGWNFFIKVQIELFVIDIDQTIIIDVMNYNLLVSFETLHWTHHSNHNYMLVIFVRILSEKKTLSTKCV